jgi:polysaccharide deacetylase family protein (PEP-CTERM system associated)
MVGLFSATMPSTAPDTKGLVDGVEPIAFALKTILSFDVEEHYRIEAAKGVPLATGMEEHCRERLDASTNWLLDLLAAHGTQATFFIVGEIAGHNPALVRRIAREGHEVASHGWDHRRVHHFTPATFAEDVARSKKTLEDVTGEAVVGYRAPTFSIMRETAWAIDVLAEVGMAYDSSIYPVHHDRYGVPAAPRTPFLAQGERRTLLELPPATLRLLRMNFPMGGGGYFRLFPQWVTEWALRQTERQCRPAVAMLYFHPWEFDGEQRHLPLGRLASLRTYVGIGRSPGRLSSLLGRYRFSRAIDVVREMGAMGLSALPTFEVGVRSVPLATQAPAEAIHSVDVKSTHRVDPPGSVNQGGHHCKPGQMG